MTKKYNIPDLYINIFDENDVLLTGSSNPSVDDVANFVKDSSSGITLDGKSGDEISNLFSLTW